MENSTGSNSGSVSVAASVAYNIVTSSSSSPDGDFELVRNLNFYALAFIIPIGIVANCLAFIVIGLSYMSRSTTGHYLLSLALADTISYTEPLSPIPSDIHRLIQYCIHRGRSPR